MTEITKADLTDLKDDIKDHIDLKLKPVVDDVEDHKILLNGKSGRNGIIEDVSNMKTGVGIFKWLSGAGFLGMAAKWWHG